jgi:hypothetical protein
MPYVVVFVVCVQCLEVVVRFVDIIGGIVDHLFIDIPVISGHSVINFTNGFDIMVSYYSYPKDNNHHLYLGDVELVPSVSISNAVIPLLFHRTVASIGGKVMIITE